jgi:protein tyrosine/serine phosphatase
VIAEPDGATLVHCAAGKDRTGVVVALALSEVGVERDSVVADYVATSERIRDVLRRLAATPTYARDVDADDVDNIDRHLPRAATMHTLLAEMDEQDGGVGNWLRRHGWTESDAAALRARLLDE